MPDPLNTVLKGPHRAAFRAFAALLKAEPTLARVVKTWVAYEGTKDDTLALAEGSVPVIRLTPEYRGWRRATITGVRETNLIITIEIAVPGTDWGDSANLWDVIEALVASDAFCAAMDEVGVMDVEVMEPAATVNDTGSPYAVATGKILLAMLIGP